jgi:predicted  nucleic acid-binding Zn-ribbon protein
MHDNVALNSEPNKYLVGGTWGAIKRTILSLDTQKTENQQKLIQAKDELTDAKTGLRTSKTELDSINTLINGQEQKIQRITKRKKDLPNNQYNQLARDKEISDATVKIGELEKQKNALNEKIGELNEKIGELNEKINKYTKNKENIEKKFAEKEAAEKEAAEKAAADAKEAADKAAAEKEAADKAAADKAAADKAAADKAAAQVFSTFNPIVAIRQYFKGIEKQPTLNVNDKKQVDTKKPDDVVISAIIKTIVDNATLEDELAALKSIPVNDDDVNNSIKDSCNKFNIDLNVNTIDKIVAIDKKFYEKFVKDHPIYEEKPIELNGTTYKRVETGKRGHCMYSSVIFGMFLKQFKFPDSIKKNSGWNPPIDGFVKSKEKQHENCFAGNLRDVMAHYICKSTKVVDEILGNDNIRKKDILKRLIIDKPLSVSVDKDKYAQDDEIKILSNLLNTKIGVFIEKDNTTGLVVYMPNGGVKTYFVDDYNKYHYENDIIYIYNTNDHFQYMYPEPNEAAIKFAARRNEETVIESVINTIVNPTNNRSSSSVNITGDNKLEMKQTQETLDRLNKINEEIEELKIKKEKLKEERMGLDPTNDATRIKEIDDELAEIKKAKEELVTEQNQLNKIGNKNISWWEIVSGLGAGGLTAGAVAGAGDIGALAGVGATGVAAGAVLTGAAAAVGGITAYKYFNKGEKKAEKETKEEEEKKAEKETKEDEEKIRRRYEHTVNITHDVSTEPNSAGDHTRYSTVTVTDIPSATTAEQVEHALYNLLNDSKDSKRINETITFTPENSKVEENK